MKFKNISILLLMAGLLGFSGCDNEELDSKSIFDDVVIPEKNEFDNWLETNYRKAYNIDFKYRFSDKESDRAYNVIPANYDQSVALAILIKHVWLDAYSEAVSQEFMKTYVPRIIQLTGSYKWNDNGKTDARPDSSQRQDTPQSSHSHGGQHFDEASARCGGQCRHT